MEMHPSGAYPNATKHHKVLRQNVFSLLNRLPSCILEEKLRLATPPDKQLSKDEVKIRDAYKAALDEDLNALKDLLNSLHVEIVNISNPH